MASLGSVGLKRIVAKATLRVCSVSSWDVTEASLLRVDLLMVECYICTIDSLSHRLRLVWRTWLTAKRSFRLDCMLANVRMTSVKRALQVGCGILASKLGLSDPMDVPEDPSPAQQMQEKIHGFTRLNDALGSLGCLHLEMC